MNTSLHVSVVICTFNRADLLKLVLQDLLVQTYPKEFYEIVVIDNNSTDHTVQVVSSFNTDTTLVHYFTETKVGLSHARNKGVEVAKGAWIAYVDDDCRIRPEWLSLASQYFNEASIQVLGGSVYPFYLGDKPVWYKDEYAVKHFGKKSQPMQPDEYLIGCNFMTRRTVFEQAGYFDPTLGMNGSAIGYGEETEWQMRVKQIWGNNSVFYDSELFVRHLERPEQLTIKWLTRSFINKGRDNFKMHIRNCTHHSQHVLFYFSKIFLSYFLIVIHFLIGYVARNKQVYPYVQNYHFAKFQGHWKRIGFMTAALKYKLQ